MTNEGYPDDKSCQRYDRNLKGNFWPLKIKHPNMVFRLIEIKMGVWNLTIHNGYTFSLMKPMEVSFQGSSDHLELKSDVPCSGINSE